MPVPLPSTLRVEPSTLRAEPSTLRAEGSSYSGDGGVTAHETSANCSSPADMAAGDALLQRSVLLPASSLASPTVVFRPRSLRGPGSTPVVVAAAEALLVSCQAKALSSSCTTPPQLSAVATVAEDESAPTKIAVPEVSAAGLPQLDSPTELTIRRPPLPCAEAAASVMVDTLTAARGTGRGAVNGTTSRSPPRSAQEPQPPQLLAAPRSSSRETRPAASAAISASSRQGREPPSARGGTSSGAAAAACTSSAKGASTSRAGSSGPGQRTGSPAGGNPSMGCRRSRCVAAQGSASLDSSGVFAEGNLSSPRAATIRQLQLQVQRFEIQCEELCARNSALELENAGLRSELDVLRVRCEQRTSEQFTAASSSSSRVASPVANGASVVWGPPPPAAAVGLSAVPNGASAASSAAASGAARQPQRGIFGGVIEDGDRLIMADAADPISERAEVARYKREIVERDALLLELQAEVRAQSQMLQSLMAEARTQGAPASPRAVGSGSSSRAPSAGQQAGGCSAAAATASSLQKQRAAPRQGRQAAQATPATALAPRSGTTSPRRSLPKGAPHGAGGGGPSHCSSLASARSANSSAGSGSFAQGTRSSTRGGGGNVTVGSSVHRQAS